MPTLLSKYAWSPTARLAVFKKHPAFHGEELARFVSDAPIGFFARQVGIQPDTKQDRTLISFKKTLRVLKWHFDCVLGAYKAGQCRLNT